MKKELQVKELRMTDATRRDFLQHQQRVKEACIRRLDDQIKKRVSPNSAPQAKHMLCVCVCRWYRGRWRQRRHLKRQN